MRKGPFVALPLRWTALHPVGTIPLGKIAPYTSLIDAGGLDMTMKGNAVAANDEPSLVWNWNRRVSGMRDVCRARMDRVNTGILASSPPAFRTSVSSGATANSSSSDRFRAACSKLFRSDYRVTAHTVLGQSRDCSVLQLVQATNLVEANLDGAKVP